MPTFHEDVWAEVSVEPKEFINMCDEKEIRQTIQALVDAGFLRPSSEVETTSPRGYNHQEFLNSIDTLEKNYYSLPQEDIDTINKIAKRF
jgi:hypothetical protein